MGGGGDWDLSPLDLEDGLTVVDMAALPPAPVKPAPLPRIAGFFLDDFAGNEPHYFLDACALCNKPLGSNRDIYMYRGDTPFCSEECRQEQIAMDEAAEKRMKLAAASFKKASSAIKENKSSKNQSIGVRPGAVVAG